MESSVAKRYSKALFLLNKNSENMNIKLLCQFASIIDNNKPTATFLSHPIITKQNKMAFIEEIMSKHKLEKLYMNFIKVIVEAGRINLFSQIMSGYLKLVDEANGYIRADVTTALEISDSQKEAIGKNIKKLMGENIDIMFSINPSILGGFVVKAGNKVLDLSLAHSLSSIEKMVLA